MNAIVYTSNSGFTAKYATLLGKKLELPVYSLTEATKKINAGAEIIYLGWLMAGQIKGCKKAAKLYSIKAVCGVGMGANGSQLEDVRKNNNFSESTAVFTLQGGFDINKLHGIYKFMMNMMKNSVGKKLAEKPDKTAEETDMLDLLQNGGDRVNEANFAPVLEWYKKLANENAFDINKNVLSGEGKTVEDFNGSCPCKRIKCERHGNCDACREYHKTEKQSPPACDRLTARIQKKAERTERRKKK